MIETKSLVEAVKDVSHGVYDLGRFAAAKALDYIDQKLCDSNDLGSED